LHCITLSSGLSLIPRVSRINGVLFDGGIAKFLIEVQAIVLQRTNGFFSSRVMNLYKDIVLPRLTHFLMDIRLLVPYRKRVIASAEGRALEIGIGSGLNIPFYGSAVREVLGLEPSQPLIAMARKVAEGASIPVTFIEESAESIPTKQDSTGYSNLCRLGIPSSPVRASRCR
jgi:hypothetical protein